MGLRNNAVKQAVTAFSINHWYPDFFNNLAVYLKYQLRGSADARQEKSDDR